MKTVDRREVHAEKGLRTMSVSPNQEGLYSKKFMIEPTSLCNLKCPLCPVPTHLHRDTGHMPMHTYKTVIDDIAGYAKKIDLWNFGEPFLNEQMFDMIKYATDRNIHVRVSTNSTFLEEEQVEKIFWSNLTSIIVCLDGASKETHERYRIGSQFERVVEGISRLSQRKRALRRTLPFMRLQFLVFSYNEHEIDDIITLAERMEVDQLALKNVSLGTWIDQDIRKKISKKLLPRNDKYRKYTVDQDKLELKIQDEVCSWAYENGVVLSNGNVTTCCYDSSGRHVFANVHRDGGLLNILKSDKMKRIRQDIIDRELPLCRTCQYSDYGSTLVNFEYKYGTSAGGMAGHAARAPDGHLQGVPRRLRGGPLGQAIPGDISAHDRLPAPAPTSESYPKKGSGRSPYSQYASHQNKLKSVLRLPRRWVAEKADAMHEEGVIRFRTDHRSATLDPQAHGTVAHLLIVWWNRILRAGLVGRDPNRYGGVGFGNLSGRLPPFPGQPGARPFLVTGTQTGGRLSMTLADLCVVTRYDPERNLVESFGLVRPSSESMTHGLLYDADLAIRFVFHGHSPAIWEQARPLGLPATDPAAGYGTPAMCREVQRLLRDPKIVQGRVLVMGGHRDGVLAFGDTVEETGLALLGLLSKANRAGDSEAVKLESEGSLVLNTLKGRTPVTEAYRAGAEGGQGGGSLMGHGNRPAGTTAGPPRVVRSPDQRASSKGQEAVARQ